jgi:hypothetical protein
MGIIPVLEEEAVFSQTMSRSENAHWVTLAAQDWPLVCTWKAASFLHLASVALPTNASVGRAQHTLFPARF